MGSHSWHTYVDELPGPGVTADLLVQTEDALDLAAEDVDGAAGGEAARHRLRQVDGDEAETRDAKQQLCVQVRQQ